MAPVPDQRKRFQIRLDVQSGVPAYRQIIDQVAAALARGALATGDQLPTVRQLAVDLSINPNTVIRAYKELEIRGVIETQQGSGTFVGPMKNEHREDERQRRLLHLTGEFVARAGAEGFTVEEAITLLQLMQSEGKKRR